MKAGGNALNVVANLLIHDYPACYIGTVGNDENGEYIKNALLEIGCSASKIKKAPGKTGITKIELCQDDYRIIEEEYGVSNVIELTESEIVYIKNTAEVVHTSLTGKATEIIPKLVQTPVKISCDLGTVQQHTTFTHLKHLLSATDYAFISAGSALNREQVITLLERVASLGVSCVVATRGRHGCIALENNQFIDQEALLIGELVDPLGAGDAFISGFLSQRNSSLKTRLECASRWAAEACKKLGAW